MAPMAPRARTATRGHYRLYLTHWVSMRVSTLVSKALPAPFARQNEGSLWTGNFTPGDQLLWTNSFTSTTNNPITLRFGAFGVFGGGAQIQADFNGDFVARVTAFDAGGNLL